MNFNEQIKNSLKNGTDNAARQKDSVYQRLMLDLEKEGEMKMRRNFSWKAIGSVAAAVVVMVGVMTFTAPGRTFAERAYRFFVPEKKITNEIEGQKSKTQMNLTTNTDQEMGYAMYVDEDLYEVVKTESIDYIKFKNGSKDLPPVQMEISQVIDKAPETLKEQIIAENKEIFDTVRDDGKIQAPVDGWLVTMKKGNQPSDPYEKVYLVDNKKGGSFVIRAKMFLEAEEGHGARFSNMLKTFEVLSSDSIQK